MKLVIEELFPFHFLSIRIYFIFIILFFSLSFPYFQRKEGS